MTIIYDQTRCAELVREMRDDDERMTRAPWHVVSGPQGNGTLVDDRNHTTVADCDQRQEEACGGSQAQSNANGIARIRNRLRETADQLEAAGAAVEHWQQAREAALEGGQILKAELEAATKRIAELEAEAARMRNDWSMYNNYQLRSEFDRLKFSDVSQGQRIADLLAEVGSLRSEVAERDRRLAELTTLRAAKAADAERAIAARAAEQLAATPRPSIKLPARKEWDAECYDSGDTSEADGYESSDYVDGWNDALDEVSALNSAGQPAVSVPPGLSEEDHDLVIMIQVLLTRLIAAGKSPETVTLTFDRAALDGRLRDLEEFGIHRGRDALVQRVAIARDPAHPHSAGEAAALLVGQPSPYKEPT